MRIAQTSTDGDGFFVFLHVLPQTKHCMPPWNTLTPFGGISLDDSLICHVRRPKKMIVIVYLKPALAWGGKHIPAR